MAISPSSLRARTLAAAALTGALAASAASAVPLVAQGGAFRTSVGGTALVHPELLAPAGDRLPSGRLTAELQLGPRLGLHAGGLRLAPPDVALTGGVAGLRLNLLTGRLRLGAFAEGGYAWIQAAVDSGGFSYTTPSGSEEYRPFRREVSGTSIGGGGGGYMELILGPGLTFRVTGGYWLFPHELGALGVGPDQLPEGLVGGPLVGAGVRWAVRDMTWYWRTSGHDREGPAIAGITPMEDGVVQLGWDSARVALHDPARVVEVTLDGLPLDVIRTSVASATEEVWLRGYELRLEPGVHTLELRATDGAGNTATHRLRVQGTPPDEEAPLILADAPAADVESSAATARIAGVILDESDAVRLLIDGVPAEVAPVARDPRAFGGERRHRVYRYEADIPVPTGEVPITVAAEDGAGNRSQATHVVRRRDVRAPELNVESPERGATVPAGVTTFTGTVVDDGVVTRVRVAGVDAAVESVMDTEEAWAMWPDLRLYRFSVDVPLRDGTGPVEVVARDGVGKETRVMHPLTRTAVATFAAGGAVAVPILEIQEPAEWGRAGARGIGVAPRTSLRIRGMVRDPGGSGIREVRIDGKPAALAPVPGSGGAFRFTGFAPAPDDRGDVEIAALTVDGRQTVEVFPIEARAPPASPGAPASFVAASGVTGQRYAVVIGINDYADPLIQDLQYADADARAFYDFLRSEAAGLGGLPEENIKLLLNEQATDREIRSALYTFLQRATENDIVVIYIAAHGAPHPDRHDDLYLLAHNTEVDDVAATAIPMRHIQEAVGRLYAHHTVLITDACHSGGIGGSYGTRAMGGASMNAINQAFLMELQASQGGLAIFTASEARELSREGEQWGGGHGVFTYYLLEGLYGAADMDGDRIITLGEIMEYTRDRVQRATNNAQHPSVASQNHDRYLPMAIIPDRPGGR